MGENGFQYESLYVMKFASSFGHVTLITLLPTFIDLFDPSGLMIGLFTSALVIGRNGAILPLAWMGDRYDKRTVLLAGIGISIVAYLLFAQVGSSAGFVLTRIFQGVGLVGTGLMGLAVLGELAPNNSRASVIGTYNAWRMAAGIGGTLGAGLLYERFGFGTVFGLITLLLAVGFVGVWRYIDADDTTVEGMAFTDLAVNRRILTFAGFRVPYAFAVTLGRNWLPIYAGVAAAKGGLAYGAFAVGAVVAAMKFTNMLSQHFLGHLSDSHGRATLPIIGGTMYAVVLLAIPFAPRIGTMLNLPATFPVFNQLSPAFLPLLCLSGLLGVADSLREPASMALFADEGEGNGIASSFGIRSLLWMPGSFTAPMIAGFLMTEVSMFSVFVFAALTAFIAIIVFYVLIIRTDGVQGVTAW